MLKIIMYSPVTEFIKKFPKLFWETFTIGANPFAV